jgi:hypothetical protein
VRAMGHQAGTGLTCNSERIVSGRTGNGERDSGERDSETRGGR